MGFALEKVRPIFFPVSALLSRALGVYFFFLGRKVLVLIGKLVSGWVYKNVITR